MGHRPSEWETLEQRKQQISKERDGIDKASSKLSDHLAAIDTGRVPSGDRPHIAYQLGRLQAKRMGLDSEEETINQRQETIERLVEERQAALEPPPGDPVLGEELHDTIERIKAKAGLDVKGNR